MLILDDFLEMIDELPNELRDRCTDLRHLDLQVQTGIERNRKAILEFFQSTNLNDEQKRVKYQQLQQEYRRIRELGEEKIYIAEKMQELVEKYVQHLDKEQTHFKYELEADNPGVTEHIEKRFADYVESIIALRKDRKRKHTNGNGNDKHIEAVKAIGNFTLSNMSSSDFVFDDDLLSAIAGPMLSAGTVKGRKSTVDEFIPMTPTSATPAGRRRSHINALKGSLSVPSFNNASMVSPAVSEKSWTPASIYPPDDYSPSTPIPVTPFSATQMTPTSSMPSFSGPESRHGRPRKLTHRVQEMFKDVVQRQRHHHPAMIQVDTTTEDSIDGSEDDDEDSDGTWCFCGEKSYGDMVMCDDKSCARQWFHYPCVSLTSTPKGKWYCSECLERSSRRSLSTEATSSSSTTI